MSKYTTEVRFICEQAAGLKESVGYNSVNSVIQTSWSKIFESFPIFDESYRSVLCQKILKHYYLREICCETVGLWKFWLNERMNLIMPYYNKLYESELLSFNPLWNTDYTRGGNRESNLDENTTGTSKDDRTSKQTRENTINTEATTTDIHNNTSRDLYSETPQGALTGVESEEYLTNARKITDAYNGDINENREVTDNGTTTQDDNYQGSTTGSRDANTTEEYLEKVQGKMGGDSYAKLIMDYRATFLNLDQQIIDELKDLFFALW